MGNQNGAGEAACCGSSSSKTAIISTAAAGPSKTYSRYNIRRVKDKEGQ